MQVRENCGKTEDPDESCGSSAGAGTPEQRAMGLLGIINTHDMRTAADWAIAAILYALREERALAILGFVAEIEGEFVGHSIELERLRTRAEWSAAEARQSK